jgi:dihydropteroate synthase
VCDSISTMRGRLWKIGDDIVDLSRRGLIMGVLNVTPDSFSDGGAFFDADAAVARGMEMAREGADIIDVGGESTRPGAEPISTKEELGRVIPVIAELHGKLDKLISIDTSKSEIAERALNAGASIINDVTGGRGDAQMLALAAERKAALILMHMQGTPRTMQIEPHYDDVVADVGDFFLQQYGRALEFGVDPMAMAFDPGIGFGKTLAHNVELLKNLARLRVHDRPLAIGVSRKAFLAKLTGASDMKSRVAPTVALTALLRVEGADILRVHDVTENVAAMRVVEAMLS